MSYPDPRYHGTTGEASASYRPADHPPELIYPSGNTAHYLATGASTEGTYGLYRWVMGPEPPPSGLLANCKIPLASQPISSRFTSSEPSGATMPSQRADRSTS